MTGPSGPMVRLKDPKEFSEAFDEVNGKRTRGALARAAGGAEEGQQAGARKASKAGLETLSRLWNPVRRMAALSSVTGALGSTVSDEQCIADALRGH